MEPLSKFQLTGGLFKLHLKKSVISHNTKTLHYHRVESIRT